MEKPSSCKRRRYRSGSLDRNESLDDETLSPKECKQYVSAKRIKVSLEELAADKSCEIIKSHPSIITVLPTKHKSDVSPKAKTELVKLPINVKMKSNSRNAQKGKVVKVKPKRDKVKRYGRVKVKPNCNKPSATAENGLVIEIKGKLRGKKKFAMNKCRAKTAISISKRNKIASLQPSSDQTPIDNFEFFVDTHVASNNCSDNKLTYNSYVEISDDDDEVQICGEIIRTSQIQGDESGRIRRKTELFKNNGYDLQFLGLDGRQPLAERHRAILEAFHKMVNTLDAKEKELLSGISKTVLHNALDTELKNAGEEATMMSLEARNALITNIKVEQNLMDPPTTPNNDSRLQSIIDDQPTVNLIKLTPECIQRLSSGQTTPIKIEPSYQVDELSKPGHLDSIKVLTNLTLASKKLSRSSFSPQNSDTSRNLMPSAKEKEMPPSLGIVPLKTCITKNSKIYKLDNRIVQSVTTSTEADENGHNINQNSVQTIYKCEESVKPVSVSSDFVAGNIFGVNGDNINLTHSTDTEGTIKINEKSAQSNYIWSIKPVTVSIDRRETDRIINQNCAATDYICVEKTNKLSPTNEISSGDMLNGDNSLKDLPRNIRMGLNNSIKTIINTIQCETECLKLDIPAVVESTRKTVLDNANTIKKSEESPSLHISKEKCFDNKFNAMTDSANCMIVGSCLSESLDGGNAKNFIKHRDLIKEMHEIGISGPADEIILKKAIKARHIQNSMESTNVISPSSEIPSGYGESDILHSDNDHNDLSTHIDTEKSELVKFTWKTLTDNNANTIKKIVDSQRLNICCKEKCSVDATTDPANCLIVNNCLSESLDKANTENVLIQLVKEVHKVDTSSPADKVIVEEDCDAGHMELSVITSTGGNRNAFYTENKPETTVGSREIEIIQCNEKPQRHVAKSCNSSLESQRTLICVEKKQEFVSLADSPNCVVDNSLSGTLDVSIVAKPNSLETFSEPINVSLANTDLPDTFKMPIIISQPHYKSASLSNQQNKNGSKVTSSISANDEELDYEPDQMDEGDDVLSLFADTLLDDDVPSPPKPSNEESGKIPERNSSPDLRRPVEIPLETKSSWQESYFSNLHNKDKRVITSSYQPFNPSFRIPLVKRDAKTNPLLSMQLPPARSREVGKFKLPQNLKCDNKKELAMQEKGLSALRSSSLVNSRNSSLKIASLPLNTTLKSPVIAFNLPKQAEICSKTSSKSISLTRKSPDNLHSQAIMYLKTSQKPRVNDGVLTPFEKYDNIETKMSLKSAFTQKLPLAIPKHFTEKTEQFPMLDTNVSSLDKPVSSLLLTQMSHHSDGEFAVINSRQSTCIADSLKHDVTKCSTTSQTSPVLVCDLGNSDMNCSSVGTGIADHDKSNLQLLLTSETQMSSEGLDNSILTPRPSGSPTYKAPMSSTLSANEISSVPVIERPTDKNKQTQFLDIAIPNVNKHLVQSIQCPNGRPDAVHGIMPALHHSPTHKTSFSLVSDNQSSLAFNYESSPEKINRRHILETNNSSQGTKCSSFASTPKPIRPIPENTNVNSAFQSSNQKSSVQILERLTNQTDKHSPVSDRNVSKVIAKQNAVSFSTPMSQNSIEGHTAQNILLAPTLGHPVRNDTASQSSSVQKAPVPGSPTDMLKQPQFIKNLITPTKTTLPIDSLQKSHSGTASDIRNQLQDRYRQQQNEQVPVHRFQQIGDTEDKNIISCALKWLVKQFVNPPIELVCSIAKLLSKCGLKEDIVALGLKLLNLGLHSRKSWLSIVDSLMACDLSKTESIRFLFDHLLNEPHEILTMFLNMFLDEGVIPNLWTAVRGLITLPNYELPLNIATVLLQQCCEAEPIDRIMCHEIRFLVLSPRCLEQLRLEHNPFLAKFYEIIKTFKIQVTQDDLFVKATLKSKEQVNINTSPATSNSLHDVVSVSKPNVDNEKQNNGGLFNKSNSFSSGDISRSNRNQGEINRDCRSVSTETFSEGRPSDSGRFQNKWLQTSGTNVTDQSVTQSSLVHTNESTLNGGGTCLYNESNKSDFTKGKMLIQCGDDRKSPEMVIEQVMNNTSFSNQTNGNDCIVNREYKESSNELLGVDPDTSLDTDYRNARLNCEENFKMINNQKTNALTYNNTYQMNCSSYNFDVVHTEHTRPYNAVNTLSRRQYISYKQEPCVNEIVKEETQLASPIKTSCTRFSNNQCNPYFGKRKINFYNQTQNDIGSRVVKPSGKIEQQIDLRDILNEKYNRKNNRTPASWLSRKREEGIDDVLANTNSVRNYSMNCEDRLSPPFMTNDALQDNTYADCNKVKFQRECVLFKRRKQCNFRMQDYEVRNHYTLANSGRVQRSFEYRSGQQAGQARFKKFNNPLVQQPNNHQSTHFLRSPTNQYHLTPDMPRNPVSQECSGQYFSTSQLLCHQPVLPNPEHASYNQPQPQPKTGFQPDEFTLQLAKENYDCVSDMLRQFKIQPGQSARLAELIYMIIRKKNDCVSAYSHIVGSGLEATGYQEGLKLTLTTIGLNLLVDVVADAQFTTAVQLYNTMISKKLAPLDGIILEVENRQKSYCTEFRKFLIICEVLIYAKEFNVVVPMVLDHPVMAPESDLWKVDFLSEQYDAICKLCQVALIRMIEDKELESLLRLFDYVFQIQLNIYKPVGHYHKWSAACHILMKEIEVVSYNHEKSNHSEKEAKMCGEYVSPSGPPARTYPGPPPWEILHLHNSIQVSLDWLVHSSFTDFSMHFNDLMVTLLNCSLHSDSIRIFQSVSSDIYTINHFTKATYRAIVVAAMRLDEFNISKELLLIGFEANVYDYNDYMVLIYSNMLTEEITLLLRYAFDSLKNTERRNQSELFLIKIKMERHLDRNSPEILQNVDTSKQAINNRISHVLSSIVPSHVEYRMLCGDTFSFRVDSLINHLTNLQYSLS